jgi:hypothetical protein
MFFMVVVVIIAVIIFCKEENEKDMEYNRSTRNVNKLHMEMLVLVHLFNALISK